MKKFFSRLSAAQVIEIKNRKVISLKGKHSNRLISYISTMCEDHEITNGEIWISGDKRVSFSKEFPENIHQRFRNVIIDTIT